MKAITAVLMLLLAGVAMAVDTQPASAPAPTPDYTSPRAIVRSFLEMSRTGDLDALEKCGEPVTVAGERDIVRNVLAAEFFPCALGCAAAEQFGPEKAGEWLSWQEKYKAFLAALDKYDEKITGDEAQLVPPSPDAAGPSQRLKTINVRKVNGQWRLVITLKVLDDPEHQAESLRAGKASREMTELMCKEIRAGKFATFEAAKAALTERRKAIAPMTKWTRPATVHTQPVTRAERPNPD